MNKTSFIKYSICAIILIACAIGIEYNKIIVLDVSCILKSKVEEITAVKHRTAHVRLENGIRLYINQPNDLKTGNEYCLIYKKRYTNGKEPFYKILHSIYEEDRKQVNDELEELKQK